MIARGFDCGQPKLNDFLMRYACPANESGASKTYVAVDSSNGTRILGFYTLSPAQIDFQAVSDIARPGGGGRHAIGGFRLGRLAVATAYQSHGLGGELLIACSAPLHSSIGRSRRRAAIDAKDERIADWYRSDGTVTVPKAPLSLVLPYSVFIAVMEQVGKPII